VLKKGEIPSLTREGGFDIVKDGRVNSSKI
jgi:hypothetical protein